VLALFPLCFVGVRPIFVDDLVLFGIERMRMNALGHGDLLVAPLSRPAGSHLVAAVCAYPDRPTEAFPNLRLSIARRTGRPAAHETPP
jgi:hypothetical protein